MGSRFWTIAVGTAILLLVVLLWNGAWRVVLVASLFVGTLGAAFLAFLQFVPSHRIGPRTHRWITISVVVMLLPQLVHNAVEVYTWFDTPPPTVDEQKQMVWDVLKESGISPDTYRKFARHIELVDLFFPPEFRTVDEAAFLSEQNKQALKMIVQLLNEYARTDVLVQGHSDARGTNEYNLVVGERRAKSVLHYVVAQGVAPRRVSIQSLGNGRPLVPISHPDSLKLDNRVHFVFQ